ncbi:MAG: FecR domain-containing protein [Gammaproteobacteria bacterium]|nr:FecR domain-containing protein [Gammaproteobacteria bacterium]
MPTDAAAWDARLRSSDCSDEERRAFRTWRHASAQNQREYDHLQSVLSDLRESRHDPEIRSFREWATDHDIPGHLFRLNRRYMAWAAGTALVAFLGAVSWLVISGPGNPLQPRNLSADVLSTAIGDRATFSLEDGTTIVLNTNTQVTLDFSADERRIVLHQGQALFDVSEDTESPFVVTAGDHRVVALGTVFEVQFEGAGISVTLVEGTVEVSPVGENLWNGGKPLRLLAGQRLTADSARMDPPDIIFVDLEQAALWREGRVYFEDTPLSEAVAEMNRYSTLKIALDDTSLEDIRVNGVFQSGRQTNFAIALEAYFPVRAVRRNPDLIVLQSN